MIKHMPELLDYPTNDFFLLFSRSQWKPDPLKFETVQYSRKNSTVIMKLNVDRPVYIAMELKNGIQPTQ